MNDAKRKRIMYAVFILAALWGLYMQPWKRQTRQAPEPVPSEPAAATAVAAAVTGTAAPLPMMTAELEWPADPFRPSRSYETESPEERPKDSPAEPILQGTMTVRGAEVCVLDGRVCKEGDRHGIWQVVRIAKGEVMLLGPNQERLPLRAQDNDGQRSDNSP